MATRRPNQKGVENHHRDGLKHFMAETGNEALVAIRIERSGLTEVFLHPGNKESEPRLVLHCDGPEWRASPLWELDEKLATFPPLGAAAGTRRQDPPAWMPKLRAAIMGLLDGERSCILALMSDTRKLDEFLKDARTPKAGRDRARTFREHHLEEMRGDCQLEEDLTIETLSLPSLQALLSLDGAHCLSSDGRFLALGLRILGGGGETGADDDPGQSGGSGAAAAQTLADNPLFRGNLIVKVSAGGTIRYYTHSPGK